MKKIWTCILFALPLAIATPAHAEEFWTCSYSGNWVTTATGNNDTFTWSIQWRKSGGGWHMVGDYQDKYGSSRFDGHCANKSCRFHQRYIGGKLSGKTYFYEGSYTDRWFGDNKSVNSFNGTWGYSKDDLSGGTWSASATCDKQ